MSRSSFFDDRASTCSFKLVNSLSCAEQISARVLTVVLTTFRKPAIVILVWSTLSTPSHSFKIRSNLIVPRKEIEAYYEQHPEKVPSYTQVVVDEFQDFNALEVSLIDLLAQADICCILRFPFFPGWNEIIPHNRFFRNLRDWRINIQSSLVSLPGCFDVIILPLPVFQ